jgi:NAD(P)-dependent dehydrogenase (short-subunit alcohol dehydrogenase family)
MFELNDKVAVVTGGSRGIGKGIALTLARAGADIAIADLLDANDAVKEVEALGRKAISVKTDVSNKKSVESMVKEVVSNFGKIDIMVNNAGILRLGPIENMEEKEWEKVIDVNLKGCFLCSQAAGKEMIKQKSGCIINTASVAGLAAYQQGAAYSASKAGIILLTKALAIEWGKHGIRVNAICPGAIQTDMTKDMLEDEKVKQGMLVQIPLGRIGLPEDIGGAALFLASDAASYVTGHALVADGGWTASL